MKSNIIIAAGVAGAVIAASTYYLSNKAEKQGMLTKIAELEKAVAAEKTAKQEIAIKLAAIEKQQDRYNFLRLKAAITKIQRAFRRDHNHHIKFLQDLDQEQKHAEVFTENTSPPKSSFEFSTAVNSPGQKFKEEEHPAAPGTDSSPAKESDLKI